MVDEVCFIFGPIISIGLSTAWFPEAGPLLAACFLAAGVFWLTAQRATEPRPHPREQHSGRLGAALARPPGPGGHLRGDRGDLRGGRRGHRRLRRGAGPQGARRAWCWPSTRLGSCLAGAVFGLLHLEGPPERRWLLGMCAMAVSMIPLLLVGNLPFLAVALFVAGLSIAPTMVTTMALVEQHVPRAQLTEGMTWVSTGLAVGVALGSSVAGWVIDARRRERPGTGCRRVSGARRGRGRRSWGTAG